MPKMVRQDIDDLNIKLSLTVSKEDYADEFKKKLNQARRQANMKGFRAGKAPMSFIRKMFGKSILADIVNEELQKGIVEYFKENEFEYLGQAIPSQDQIGYDFDLRSAGDFTFTFDLGLPPKFDLQGFDNTSTVTQYKVSADDETIDKEIDRERKRHGENVEGTEVEKDDLLKLKLEELQDGEVKEGGVSLETFQSMDLFADEVLRDSLIGKGLGYVFEVNINNFEKDRSEEDVRKYILGVDENVQYNETFKATIIEIKRQVLAEVNEEFIKKMFPQNEELKTEEDLRAKLADDITAFYEGQAENIFLRDLQDTLLEKNNIPLPDDFLKRWLATNNEEKSLEEIEAEFDSFKEGLRWKLIVNKITENNDIKIENEEVREGFAKTIKGYFGGQMDDEEYLNSMVNRMMEDNNAVEQQVSQLLNEKVINVAQETLTIEEKAVTVSEFIEIIQKINEEANAKKLAKEITALSTGVVEELTEEVKELTEEVEVVEEKAASEEE